MTTPNELVDDLPGPAEHLGQPRIPRSGVDVLRRLEADGIIRVLDVVDVDLLRVVVGIDHPLTALVELAGRLVDHAIAIKLVAANTAGDVAGPVDRALIRLLEAVERIEQAAGGEVSDRTRLATDLIENRR